MGSAILALLGTPGVIEGALAVAAALVSFVAGHKNWIISPPKKTATNPLLDMFLQMGDGHVRAALQDAVARIFHRNVLPEPMPMPDVMGMKASMPSQPALPPVNLDDLVDAVTKVVAAFKQPAPVMPDVTK